MRKIAIYGKGGIGKSTTTSNLSAALAKSGYRVMQIGCDPKQDSTINLVGGQLLPSILETIKEKGEANVELSDICFEGFGGVIVTEAGGPEPGMGCAGRGVISALNLLDSLDAYNYFGIDYAIYDVLGDVVCGGFAMPMRDGYASEVYVVTSGEMMALFAANNISKAVKRFSENGVPVSLGGIICNSRKTHNEEELVSEFASNIKTQMVKIIPRSGDIQIAEAGGMTVVEALPNGNQTNAYMELAQTIAGNQHFGVPSPLVGDELSDLLNKYAEEVEVDNPVSAYG